MAEITGLTRANDVMRQARSGRGSSAEVMQLCLDYIELHDEAATLRAKIAKLRGYVGGPLVPTGDPAYDNGRDTVRCEVLAILDSGALAGGE